jgi:signal transduction histidine kinase
MFFPCSEVQFGPEVAPHPSSSRNPVLAAQPIAQEMLQSLIAAQEKELGNIARELHDDVCQRLAMLSMKIEKVAAAWAQGQTNIGEQLERIWCECSALAGHVQTLSHDLHPSLLDAIGLLASIKSLCREVSEQSCVAIEFTSKDVPDSLSGEVSLALYRLVQEALHNSIKYSSADHCHVHLQGERGQVELEVRDWGVGFDVAGVTGKGGLGLISMRERIHLLDGQIKIESKPNYGTRIRASVPLKAQCKNAEHPPGEVSRNDAH